VGALAQTATAPAKIASSRSRKKGRPVKDQSWFEAQLDPGFADEVAGEVPGAEKLRQQEQQAVANRIDGALQAVSLRYDGRARVRHRST